MNETDRKQLEKLGAVITHGDLANADLTCPLCNETQVTFSFSKIPNSQRYGLFLLCKKCKYSLHFNIVSKPPNFREDLVLQKYQDRENRVAEFIKSGRPLSEFRP